MVINEKVLAVLLFITMPIFVPTKLLMESQRRTNYQWNHKGDKNGT